MLKETEKLEIENRQLEERLQKLKMSMKEQKQARQERGYTWRSGRSSGTLKGHAQEVLQQNGTRRREGTRVKVLTGSEPEASAAAAASAAASPKRRGPAAPGGGDFSPAPAPVPAAAVGGGPATASLPPCGQCEENSANVQCRECEELYCSGCFSSFHQRGALKRHHAVPLVQRVRPQSSRARARASATQAATASCAGLMDGAFDEQASHASFLDALNEWRSGGGSAAAAASATPAAAPAPGTDITKTGFVSDSGVYHPPPSNAAAGTRSAGSGELPPEPEGGGGALLRGPAFNEAESHAAFADAVEAWRRGNSEGGSGGDPAAAAPKMWQPPAAVAAASMEIQTDAGAAPPSPSRPPPNPDDIVFDGENSTSVSYMERIMLKRARNTPLTRSRDLDEERRHGEDGEGDAEDDLADTADAALSSSFNGIDLSDDENFAEAGAAAMLFRPSTAAGAAPSSSSAAESSAGSAGGSSSIEICEVTDAAADGGDETCCTPCVVEEPDEDDEGEEEAAAPTGRTMLDMSTDSLAEVAQSDSGLRKAALTPSLMHDFEEMEEHVNVAP